MPDENPQKIKEIRRFSAIYGRFDAKRKPEKPLTLHEVWKPKSKNGFDKAARMSRMCKMPFLIYDDIFLGFRQWSCCTIMLVNAISIKSTRWTLSTSTPGGEKFWVSVQQRPLQIPIRSNRISFKTVWYKCEYQSRSA